MPLDDELNPLQTTDTRFDGWKLIKIQVKGIVIYFIVIKELANDAPLTGKLHFYAREKEGVGAPQLGVGAPYR